MPTMQDDTQKNVISKTDKEPKLQWSFDLIFC